MLFTPFWFDEAINEADIRSALPLRQNIDTNICIIGGGFTGLWTAINLKQSQPELDVVIIEKDLCGQGASGRNGGAMLTWSTKFASLIKHMEIEQAAFLVKSSEQAVHDIKTFTEQYGIACDCRIDGTYYTASNAAQKSGFAPILSLLDTHHLNAWQAVEESNLAKTGSPANLSAIYSPNAGSVQPAKLVRGLLRVAKKLGVKVFENTRYLGYQAGETIQITTSGGVVRANKLLFSVNAWLPRLMSEFKRAVVLVSSDMVISKPDPERLASMSLAHGAPIIDNRIFVNYYRSTSTGRLMLGKGGNYFSFANKVTKRFDQPSQYLDIMQHYWQHFFKNSGLEIERSWTGPSDRSVTGLPFFGYLPRQTNVFYGSGYSGNGVVQSYLGGKILSSLMLNKHDKWQRCALVNQTLSQFPIEPVRTCGAYVVRNAIRRKEYAEDRGHLPKLWDVHLSKLSGSAAKVDPNLKATS
ncbi:FAD-dependent oxidoreductase [Pseudoalteromonas sp. MMG005]|uniref:FAD-dependent oxidoreductase n=1 Tax=Pseudoalteromonas sp. MMG005 TaxID=2822682 RepID=UPI001B3A44E7|nr:FAD-dependent oxidoreductase [Pseudoalteromonas sp. MMG005]MBQ4847937.1 FAD-dependent oxidoreductase [Pseudoalteromonas sp. MMG005]